MREVGSGAVGKLSRLLCVASLAFSAVGCVMVTEHDPDKAGGGTTEPVPTPDPDEQCTRERGEPIEVAVEPRPISAGCEAGSLGVYALNVDGFATASDAAAKKTAAAAFDGNTGTKLMVSGNAGWIAYEFGGLQAHVVASYSLTPASDADGNGVDTPTNWEFQGSRDGPCVDELTWTTLDRRDGESFADRHDTRNFTTTNTTAYHRYRLLVTSGQAAQRFQLSEVQLFGPGEAAFSVDDLFRHDAANRATFSATWSGKTIDHESERFHGSSSWSSTPGEFMTFSFVGSRAKLFCVEDPAHGLAAVSLDDGPEENADLYGPVTKYDHLVYTSPLLCPGAHTMTVRVTGEKNPASKGHFISIDRIEVLP